MTDKYILDGKTPVPCDDLHAWGRMFESANRIVAKDEIGDVRISTVFLGLSKPGVICDKTQETR